MGRFGNCSRCGGSLSPVYFIEEEEVYERGYSYKTGRKRTAVSHLTCTSCLKDECIDGSFDDSWIKE